VRDAGPTPLLVVRQVRDRADIALASDHSPPVDCGTVQSNQTDDWINCPVSSDIRSDGGVDEDLAPAGQ